MEGLILQVVHDRTHKKVVPTLLLNHRFDNSDLHVTSCLFQRAKEGEQKRTPSNITFWSIIKTTRLNRLVHDCVYISVDI
jgi:hypothetical protein